MTGIHGISETTRHRFEQSHIGFDVAQEFM
jgi:hypothetical protein